MPERDTGDGQERDVEPHPLPEGTRLGPGEPALLGREAARGQHRGQHQQRHTHDGDGAGGKVALHGDPRLRLEANIGQRPHGVQDRHGRDRQPGPEDRGRDRDQDPLSKREEAHLRGPGPAGEESGGVGPPVVHQQGRDEDDRVDGKDRQLRHQQVHVGAAHQERAFRIGEKRREPHRDGGRLADVRPQPVGQGLQRPEQRRRAVHRQPCQIQGCAPPRVNRTDGNALQEVVGGREERPEGSVARSIQDAGGELRVAVPVGVGDRGDGEDAHEAHRDHCPVAYLGHEQQLVTDGEAELLRDRVHDNDRDGSGRIAALHRPAAADQRGVAWERVQGAQDGQVAFPDRWLAGQRERRGAPHVAQDAAVHRRGGVLQVGHDLVVDGGDACRCPVERDFDRRLRDGIRGDRPAQPRRGGS